MFLVFGTKSRIRTGDQVLTEVCPSCGNNLHVSYGITRYFQIFWIPFFPYKRLVGLRCHHCDLARDGKDLPEQVRGILKPKLFNFFRLIPFFSGIFLFIALGYLFNWDENRSKQEHMLLIENPVVGDIYEMKINDILPNTDPDYPYYLALVAARDSNVVKLALGFLGYDGFMGTSNAIRHREYTRGTYFQEQRIPVTIETLKQWRSSGDLFDVIRP